MPLSPLTLKTHWMFDMDGTLTHAVHDFDAIREQLELPPGKPILEALADLPDDIAKQKHQHLDEIEFEIAEQATAQPDSANLLQSLLDKGCNIGIVTRNGRDIAHATLKACGLFDFFTPDSIIGRECAAPKPEPDGVELLLKRWNAKANNAVMVGDFMFDLVAGRKAGAATVHFDALGQTSWPEWTDYRVTSLTELNSAMKS